MESRIITWDEPKRQANIAKHHMDFADLTAEFFAAALELDAHSGRLAAIGPLHNTSSR
ncbi:BrnT family toxin [Paracoccus sp. (in: a-proteobacteria)]|uniref:BrnT family toxin n=1 Tax=Paracoccus sp. TaxID=267 RepID=UPI003A83BDFD